MLFRSEGEWDWNAKNGQGTLFHENGTIRYEGGFSNDSYHGFGREYTDTGELVYAGLWEQGARIAAAS